MADKSGRVLVTLTVTWGLLGALSACSSGSLRTEEARPAGARPTLAAPAVAEPKKPVVEVLIPTAAEVTSKDAAFLLARFGKPDLRRAERGAEFWTYMHRRCSVFFILYEEGEAVYSVHHVEVERHMADSRSLEEQIDACLSDIAYAHQAPEADSGMGM